MPLTKQTALTRALADTIALQQEIPIPPVTGRLAFDPDFIAWRDQLARGLNQWWYDVQKSLQDNQRNISVAMNDLSA